VRKLVCSLSNKRFKHTIGVAILAAELASLHRLDEEKAVLASLLHDYARERDKGELLALAQQANWPINKVEQSQPMLLHGPAAAFLATEEWGIEDQDVLNAIAYHTTGHPDLSPLSCLLYVADMVEYGRAYPGVEKLRDLAFQDLKVALLACLDHSIRYLLDRGALIHSLSIETRNELLSEICQKGEV